MRKRGGENARRIEVVILGDDVYKSVPLSAPVSESRGRPALRKVSYARALHLLFDGCPSCGNTVFTFLSDSPNEVESLSKKAHIRSAKCAQCGRELGFRDA